MQPIRAFVAHSFAEADKPVVDAILEYLDTVSKLEPRFTWDHAKGPEPVEVDAKVLSLLSDKNLLIAICTGNERVIRPSALSKKFFLPNSLVGQVRDFEWKTSDWIIQEIGLAVGRSMKIIVLLEEGTRPPGALQGNIERIPFHRATPERCFDKLLGMIAALSPHADGAQAAAATDEIPQTAENTKTNEKGDSSHYLTPQPNWKIREYKLALMHYMHWRDEEQIKSISSHFLQTDEGQIETNKQEWTSALEYFRVVFDYGGNLTKVKQLAIEYPTNSKVVEYLARCYEHYEQHGEAANAYEAAAKIAGDSKAKILLLGNAALSHQKDGKKAKAVVLYDRSKKILSEAGDGEKQVLEWEQKLAEHSKDSVIEITALERLLELDPADDDSRFALAYKYSQMGDDDLAVYHYLRIPAANRTPIAWNNLGVSLSGIGLPIKAISAYRESQTKGETLAMSNLAHKFLESGFLEEAKAMVDAALKIPDHHKNIDKALGTIETNQEEEGKRETASLEKSKLASAYYRQFGRSLAKPLATNISARWKSPNCELKMVVTGTTLVAIGSYERSSGIGLLGLAGFSDPRQWRYCEEFRGEMRGRSIVGTVSRNREGEKLKASSLLTALDDSLSVLMWISDADDKIHVLERKSNGEPQFYMLERL